MRQIKKKTLSHIFCIGICFVGLASCFQEAEFLVNSDVPDTYETFNGAPVFLDEVNNIALVSVPEFGSLTGSIGLKPNDSLIIEGQSVVNKDQVSFEDIGKDTRINVQFFSNSTKHKSYTLQFTKLPIIHIQHSRSEIPDEPKVAATAVMYFPSDRLWMNAYCKIELRGGSSQRYDKKSYAFKFFNDKYSKEVALSTGLLPGENWILDAAYVDKSRVRNRFSFDVWEKMQLSEHEPNIKSAVHGVAVELFINSNYIGVYWLSEKLDAERLQLQNTIDTKSLLVYKSEDWSAVTQFKGLRDTISNAYNWEGWEFKSSYNGHRPVWAPFYEFVDFVVRSSDSVFAAQVPSLLNLNQAIDYYILMNLMKGSDNAGKNVFMIKANAQSPFCICPWDMDATWGRNWKAEKVDANKTVSYNLFKRLIEVDPANFNNRLRYRWNELRQDVLSERNLQHAYFKRSAGISSSGADVREQLVCPESMQDMQNEKEYVFEWMYQRLEVLDQYFNSLDD